jgi:hypothetical protein
MLRDIPRRIAPRRAASQAQIANARGRSRVPPLPLRPRYTLETLAGAVRESVATIISGIDCRSSMRVTSVSVNDFENIAWVGLRARLLIPFTTTLLIPRLQQPQTFVDRSNCSLIE